jgi:hypothetical protein
MVNALAIHVGEPYYSLLAEHLKDIYSEAEASGKEDLAAAARKLLERLETPDR